MTARPAYAELLRAADELRRSDSDAEVIAAELQRMFPGAPSRHVWSAADGARRPR